MRGIVNTLADLESHYMPEPNTGCWLWLDAIHHNGYGRFRVKGREILAHRASYEFYIGQIPQILEIDHLCRNRICVNPEHMELVTRRVNVLRGVGISANNAKKAQCPRGHAYDKFRTRGARIERVCSRCRAESSRKFYSGGGGL